jgi:hypothetical protein
MNIPPEWATHLVKHHKSGDRFWWSTEKRLRVGRVVTVKNHLIQAQWERAGWTFEETNIQLEND